MYIHTMSKNLNDIAREIAQNDNIKSELPKIADHVIMLKEKQQNCSLSETEHHALIVLTFILENSQ